MRREKTIQLPWKKSIAAEGKTRPEQFCQHLGMRGNKQQQSMLSCF
jgi:hypothetical protein